MANDDLWIDKIVDRRPAEFSMALVVYSFANVTDGVTAELPPGSEERYSYIECRI